MRVRDAGCHEIVHDQTKKLGQDMTTHPEELLRDKFFPYEYFQKRNADEDDPLQYVKMRRAEIKNNLNNDGTDLITY